MFRWPRFGFVCTRSAYGPDLLTDSNAVRVGDSEADATTGWSSMNVDLFESQSAVANSSFAFHAHSNTTPANTARIYTNLTVLLTVGKTYQIDFDARHVSTGAKWRLGVGTNNSTVVTTIIEVFNTDITFTGYSYEFLYSGGNVFFIAREQNTSDDGGVYLDNFKLREKLI